MPETRYGYLVFLRLVFHQYPRRAILGSTLMITQSFLYNAIFFTYALVLIHFYDVSVEHGPPLRARLLRRQPVRSADPRAALRLRRAASKMISGTYLISGVLLAISPWLFDAPTILNATTADLHVGHHLLLRLRSCQRRLPHRERDLAD